MKQKSNYVSGEYKKMIASSPEGNQNWLFLVPNFIMSEFFEVIHLIKKTTC